MILPADAQGVAAAAAALRRGDLVVLPTETVYGLAADAANPHAVARIFAAKGRPHFNPLIIHVLDVAAAAELAVLPPAAEALAQALWPGPLTIVAPVRAGGPIAELATAGLSTIAVRAPAHPAARAVLAAFGGVIAAPSANRSGAVSPTRVEHAMADLAREVALSLDGGPCAVGLESTIVGFTDAGAVMLRPGGVPRATIERFTGPLTRPQGESVSAPGMLASHYAPRARMRLNAAAPAPGEAFIAFGDGPSSAFNLSPRGDLVEAAANLFALLRAADATGADAIAVAPIPGEGLGEAINDRLARAAAPR